MYADFLVGAPELKSLFEDVIAFTFLTQRLRENRMAQEDAGLLGVTKGMQEARQALEQAIEKSFPPSFKAYIGIAVERIIQRTPEAEEFFIDRLREKKLQVWKLTQRPRMSSENAGF